MSSASKNSSSSVQCSPASTSTLDNEKNITNLLIRTRGGQNGNSISDNYERVNKSVESPDVEKAGIRSSEERLAIAEENFQTYRLCPGDCFTAASLAQSYNTVHSSSK